MFGVGVYPVHPPALKSMVTLLVSKMAPVPVSQDVPTDRPNKFIVVDRVGGSEIAHGTVSVPIFVFQCYALNTGDAEELAELLLAELKSAQFTVVGDVQFRNFSLVGSPQHFPDPQVQDRRRWQMTGTFAINER